MTDVADRLKAWRKGKKLTAEDAAKLLRVPYTTYRGWEARRPTRYSGLIDIAIEHYTKEPLSVAEYNPFDD